MPLLPEEVADKTFPRRLWRGYDPREVDAFLRQVAGDYTAAIHQIAVAAAQRPSSYDGLGMEVAAIAKAARDAAEDVRRKAEHDAETLRRAAQQDAEQARRQLDEAGGLRADVDRREQRLAALEGRILERVREIEQQVDGLRSNAAFLDKVGRLESVAKTLRAEVEAGTGWPSGQLEAPGEPGAS